MQNRPLLKIKRAIDFCLALFCLVVGAPVLGLCVACLWIAQGRPIFFKQIRPGYQGRPFVLYKFRTMHEAKNKRGDLLPDGQRLSSVGRFFRSMSLDELPQIWNVLKGDMSFVGPRPLLMQYLSRYTSEQMRRHDMMPGITGWAQVHGRNAISWEEKFKYDVWYVDHWSFWLDLKIFFLTIWKVFKREGISQAGQATAQEFKGSSDKAVTGKDLNS
ncbi:MAG: sugar transferase [Candidatus Omnitrophota bacterium]|jgi:sugar transferase EpsL